MDLPRRPFYLLARDVSVVVPTIDTGAEFSGVLNSWLANSPLEVIVVTVEEEVPLLRNIINGSLSSEYKSKVTLLGVPVVGKRRQMVRGLVHAKGRIIVFVDDDVFWQPQTLQYILACFEDKAVGGVGTKQRAFVGGNELQEMSIWQRLADRRLKRRNKQQAAVNYLEQVVTCLSGRTAAYRLEILRDPLFRHKFTHDLWLGQHLMDSGDDTFITRWLFAHGWKFKIQTAREAKVYTVALDSSVFLRQLLRWSRNSRRSYIRYLFDIHETWR